MSPAAGPEVLEIRLFGRPAGDLAMTGALRSPEDWRFRYADDYLARPGAVALSVAMPLQSEPFEGAIARNWFCNLLPEGSAREAIERRLRIPARDDFALLAAIGGECAGAVSIGPATEPSPADDEATDLEALLARQGDDAGDGAWAALAGPRRLSLAGAQDKLAVVRERDGRLRLPKRGEPSSHILKAESRSLPGLRDLEALGLALARAVGLDVAAAELVEVSGRRALLVERYDRAATAGGVRVRLHQEDFCQALGLPPELKYQAQGGPSLARCAHLVRNVLRLGPPGLQGFLDWVAYAVLLGNADAHAKNLALLVSPDGTLRLAPMYDAVPTVVYPESMVDRAPALDVGGAPRIDAVDAGHWRRFAEEAGYAAGFVRQYVARLAKEATAVLPRVAADLVAAGADASRMARAVDAIGENLRRHA